MRHWTVVFLCGEISRDFFLWLWINCFGLLDNLFLSNISSNTIPKQASGWSSCYWWHYWSLSIGRGVSKLWNWIFCVCYCIFSTPPITWSNGLVCLPSCLASLAFPSHLSRYFHRIVPLGRFGLVVAMSVCLYACVSDNQSQRIFFHDLFEASHWSTLLPYRTLPPWSHVSSMHISRSTGGLVDQLVKP